MEASALFEVEDEDEQCSSSTTSSIGKNSDLSSETECDNEAQSAYKYNGGPLDMMDSLQQVLPIRRGISKFYNGKSKSFTSLGDAVSSPTVKDIAKPENAYSRRRRNLMAVNHLWEKNRNFPLRSNSGGISKRTISSSRSAVALAFAINYDSSSSFTSEESTSSSCPRSPPPLPPLYLYPRNRVSSASSGPSSPIQKNFSAWRSFTLADIQNCATAATIKMEAAHLSQ
ncbi:hypothetical protein SESBI_44408 [Sesbania bispinosa]|nr:hypothetical protein SESBI_44408 [Sesbania bispinosa]